MFSAWRIVLQIGVSWIFENDYRFGTALAHYYLAWTLKKYCHSTTSIWLHPLSD